MILQLQAALLADGIYCHCRAWAYYLRHATDSSHYFPTRRKSLKKYLKELEKEHPRITPNKKAREAGRGLTDDDRGQIRTADLRFRKPSVSSPSENQCHRLENQVSNPSHSTNFGLRMDSEQERALLALSQSFAILTAASLPVPKELTDRLLDTVLEHPLFQLAQTLKTQTDPSPSRILDFIDLILGLEPRPIAELEVAQAPPPPQKLRLVP